MTARPQALAEILTASHKVANRFAASLEGLKQVLPAGVEVNFSPREQEQVDAFLKRWEQLQDILSRRLVRAILVSVGEDISGFSARDAFERMETLGGLRDARRFLEIAKLRHALTHEYPISETRQIERLNAAWNSAPALLEELGCLDVYAKRSSGA